MDFILRLDCGVIRFVFDNVKCDFLDGIMGGVTMLGDNGLIWIFLTVLMIAAGKSFRKTGFAAAVSLGISAILCNAVIKPYVGRIRPYDLLNLPIAVERLSDFSFPSGHTTAAFAFAVAVYMFNRRMGRLALICAALMALTRIYLCVHYPTDVLGGIILGSLCGILGQRIILKIYENKKSYPSG